MGVLPGGPGHSHMCKGADGPRSDRCQPRRRPRHRRCATVPTVTGGAACRRAVWRRPSASTTSRASAPSPWRKPSSPGSCSCCIRPACPASLACMHGASLALAALVVSSAVRWALTTDDKLPESWLDALSVFDVGIVIGLIWSYQFDFDASASVDDQAAGLRHPVAHRRRARAALPSRARSSSPALLPWPGGACSSVRRR